MKNSMYWLARWERVSKVVH